MAEMDIFCNVIVLQCVRNGDNETREMKAACDSHLEIDILMKLTFGRIAFRR